MIMLREFDLLHERRHLLQLTDLVPELLFIHNSVKNVSPDDVRLFSYPFDVPKYFFMLDVSKNAIPYVHVAKCVDVHDTLVFEKGLGHFLSTIEDDLSNYAQIEVAGDALLIHEMGPILEHFSSGFNLTERTAHTIFYMNDEQQKDVAKINVALPYGYSFSELKLSDAALVKESSSKDSLELVKDRIQSFPSSGIVHDSSNQLISHELTSSRGDMVNLFTAPDHRRQGLAQAVELRLAQSLIRNKSTPFKAIPNHLNSLLLSSEDSPLWTMWSRDRLPVYFIVDKRSRNQD